MQSSYDLRLTLNVKVKFFVVLRCILCKSAGESVDHVFLSCLFSWKLWCFLFNEINVSWVPPEDCFSLLGEKLKVLGGAKKAKVL